MPYVVTLDALFVLAHHALSRALAEIEQREIAPLLDVLARIDVRLAAEQKGAGVELAGGYRLARGVVAVARAIAARGTTRRTRASSARARPPTRRSCMLRCTARSSTP